MTRFLSVIALCALAVPAAAKSTLYDCDITERKKGVDWVSPKVVVIIEDTGKVQVVDGIIMHFHEKPMSAKVRRKGDVLRVQWTLAGISDSMNQNIPQMRYSADLNTKAKTMELLVKPVGFPQRWRGKGTCETRTK